MAMIEVVCGLILKNGRIFICRRKPEKSLGGYWEFPGGKVEKTESYTQALSRELNEELEMEVQNLHHFMDSIYHYENFSIKLIAYSCQLSCWNNKMSDHDDFEWLLPKDLIYKKLAPADIAIALKLKENFYNKIVFNEY